MSGHVSRDARTVRLPEVSEWFAQQGLPYPDHLDAWLDSNTFGTVGRLRLVDDFDWRHKLLWCKEPYHINDFIAFRSGIVALRNELPELPLAVYGLIGLFLTTKPNLLLKVGEYDIPASCAVVRPSDLTSLCIAGGKEISDTVRFAYLHKNEQYLRRSILSSTIRNVEAWMKENDWKSLVGSQPVTSHAKYGLVTISRAMSSENVPFFQITENDGITSLEIYQDASRQILQRRFTGIVYVNDNTLGSFENKRVIERFIRSELRRGDVTLSFLQDPYSLFSDPVVAIDYKLTHVLQHMIESQYISPNDMFQNVGDPLTSDDAIKMPLLYHALFSRSNGYDCFDYIITLPNLDCRAEFLVMQDLDTWIEGDRLQKTNIIFEIIKLQVKTKFESLAWLLQSVLRHPNAPDINGKNSLGLAPLQEFCRVNDTWALPGPFDEEALKLLRFLLEHGADPTVKRANDETGVHESVIDHLVKVTTYYGDESGYDSDNDDDVSYDERMFIIRQMIWLLEKHGEGPKRSADQPPITDYFAATKRRRVE